MHLLQQDNARLQELVGQLQQQHVQQQQQQQQEQQHAPQNSSQGHAISGASTPSPLQQNKAVQQSKVATAAEDLWQKRKPNLWIVCKLLLALIPADSSQVHSLKAVQVSMCVRSPVYVIAARVDWCSHFVLKS
jgi:hypothetical protein